MKKIYACILLGCFILFASCGHDFPPRVDTKSNVYKQLSIASNGEIDSMVKRVETLKELQEFEKPLKIVRTQDEMEIITAIIEASIDGKIKMDSLGMTTTNSILLKNKNNIYITSFNQTDTTYAAKGYRTSFATRNYNYAKAARLWEYASEEYQATNRRDSISAEEKNSVELSYEKNVQLLKGLKFVILEEDALLIPPVLELEKKGFVSGYVITHLSVFDINTLEKVAQTMVLSSNSDEVGYMSFSGSSIAQYEKAAMNVQLKNDLISQKRKMVDSVFMHNNIILLR